MTLRFGIYSKLCMSYIYRCIIRYYKSLTSLYFYFLRLELDFWDWSWIFFAGLQQLDLQLKIQHTWATLTHDIWFVWPDRSVEFSNVALLSFHPGWLAFEYSIFVDSNTNRTCRYCIHCISMILGVPKFDIESMNHMLASCADPTLLTPLKAVVWLTAITHDQIISNLSTLTRPISGLWLFWEWNWWHPKTWWHRWRKNTPPSTRYRFFLAAPFGRRLISALPKSREVWKSFALRQNSVGQKRALEDPTFGYLWQKDYLRKGKPWGNKWVKEETWWHRDIGDVPPACFLMFFVCLLSMGIPTK